MCRKKELLIFAMSMRKGGAERFISLMAGPLSDTYNVTLLLFENKIMYNLPETVEVVSCLDGIPKSTPKKIRAFLIAYFHLVSYLSRERPDAVLSFLTWPNIISGLAAPCFRHTIFILSERNYSTKTSKFGGMKRMLFKKLFKFSYNRADRLFSNSKFINSNLSNEYGIKLPMSVIYNPVVRQHKYHVPKEFNAKRIITVGRFEDAKNHMLLINAMRNLSDFSLTVWGDGPLRREYEKSIRSSHNTRENVKLPGITDDIFSKLVDADIFVLSSISEGFPNVLLEAMSVGLPVISTNCLSGPLELLNDGKEVSIERGRFFEARYGVLINSQDQEALENAIRVLSDNYDMRVRYSKLGIDRASQYTVGETNERLRSIIEGR